MTGRPHRGEATQWHRGEATHPVVLMKCFVQLVKDYICSSLPRTLDPLQFAYCPNRSMEDAIAHIIHTTLSHLDKKGNYVRLLFSDYSSASNTIVPSRVITKVKDLGLNTSLCMWILDFLMGRPEVVRFGGNTSSTLILNTGAPQGCVLSPLLYSLYIHNCGATFDSNTIIKFSDDTAVVGLITEKNEKAYLNVVEDLTHCCQDKNLLLNVSKSKGLIVDFGKKQGRNYAPLNQQVLGGEDGQLQVPWCPHHRGPDLSALY